MKKLKVISLFVLPLLLASAINSTASKPERWEDTDTRTFDISDFKYIHLEGGFKVYLQQSDKCSLRIKADEDDFDYIDVDVDEEVLDIEMKGKHFSWDQIILYINFKQLEKLHIEGGVKLATRGYIELDDFYMHVEGGARIEMDVKAENIKVVGEGGVSYNLEGICRTLDARVSGAAYIDAEELKCKDVSIKIEGVGAAHVYATDYLNASIEGVGKIRYKGDPEVRKNIGGIGFVSRD